MTTTAEAKEQYSPRLRNAAFPRLIGARSSCSDSPVSIEHRRHHRVGTPELFGVNHANVVSLLNRVADREREYVTTEYIVDGWTGSRYGVDRVNLTALVAKDLPRPALKTWARQRMPKAEQLALFASLHKNYGSDATCAARTAAAALSASFYFGCKPYADMQRLVIAMVKADSLSRPVFDHFVYPWRALPEVKASRKLTLTRARYTVYAVHELGQDWSLYPDEDGFVPTGWTPGDEVRPVEVFIDVEDLADLNAWNAAIWEVRTTRVHPDADVRQARALLTAMSGRCVHDYGTGRVMVLDATSVGVKS